MKTIFSHFPRFWPGKQFFTLLIIDLIVIFLFLALFFNFFLTLSEFSNLKDDGNEFSQLGNSFLHSGFDLAKYPAKHLDCSMADGKCYWALGPFPGVLMMPGIFIWQLFGQGFYQGYLNFFLLLLIGWLAYRLARKFKFASVDSAWLSFAFCFASVYAGIIFNQMSWYFSQGVAVALIFLALTEFFNRKRFWLIGLIWALVLATRLTAGLGIVFFILYIIFNEPKKYQKKIESLIQVMLPFLAVGLILLYYNYIRFGSWFDTGYGRALVGSAYMQNLRQQFGLFNPAYILTNFYYYFLKTIEPVIDNNYSLVKPYFRVSPLGLSFFIVSPIFLKIFWASVKEKIALYSWIVSLLILAVLLCYYNSGSRQFGPRYLLDFLPFWYLLLLFSFKNQQLDYRHYSVIAASALLNFLLFLNLIFIYS